MDQVKTQRQVVQIIYRERESNSEFRIFQNSKAAFKITHRMTVGHVD